MSAQKTGDTIGFGVVVHGVDRQWWFEGEHPLSREDARHELRKRKDDYSGLSNEVRMVRIVLDK